jgi:hypothetical protein
MIALRWRLPDLVLQTLWRGPDGAIAAQAVVIPFAPVATLIGPPGVAGPPGPEGPVAEVIDGGTFS